MQGFPGSSFKEEIFLLVNLCHGLAVTVNESGK